MSIKLAIRETLPNDENLERVLRHSVKTALRRMQGKIYYIGNLILLIYTPDKFLFLERILRRYF